MLRTPTTLVLGAGASAEVDLPVGRTLLETIAASLDIRYDFSNQISGDRLVFEALRRFLASQGKEAEFNSYLHAAWQVRASANQGISIDNIVHALEDEKATVVAKLGIVRAIQHAEKRSQYFSEEDSVPGNLDYRRFENTWYDRFTKLLCEDRTRSDIDAIFENLTIVSFNCDRCIERYLPGSVANYFGAPFHEVLSSFQNVPIHRPYGIAGSFTYSGDRPVGFGTGTANELAESTVLIRTFTEGMEEPNELRSALSQSQRVVFLGSSFHRQNLDILSTALRSDVEVIGTINGFSHHDEKVVIREISENFSTAQSQIHLDNVYCREFFDDNWRKLTSAN